MQRKCRYCISLISSNPSVNPARVHSFELKNSSCTVIKFITTVQRVKSICKHELIDISVETGSMDDGLVHCIKPRGMAVDTAAAILAETVKLIAGKENDLDESNSLSS